MMYAFLACPLFSSSPPGTHFLHVPFSPLFLHVPFSPLREKRGPPRWSAFPTSGRCVPTIEGTRSYSVEMGRAPCGNELRTLWKWVVYPVEMGRVPCGNGLRTLWEGDACCENGADGNLA